MKICFIMANSYYKQPRSGSPTGLFYVAAYLKHMGCDVTFIEYPVEQPTEAQLKQDIVNEIEKEKVNIFAMGGLAQSFREMQWVFSVVKSVDKSLITMGGGGLFTLSSYEAMELVPDADVGVIGEGELIAYNVIKSINENISVNALHEVKGIIFRDANENVIKTSPGEFVEDLDSLPYPLIPPEYEKYIQHYSVASVSISRACPFSCTFCSTPTNRKYRKRSVDLVVKEIQYMIDKYEIKYFMFVDELFVSEKSRIVEFCKKVEPLGISFAAQTRASNIFDEDICLMLKSAGAQFFTFGIENINDVILTSMQKKTSRALYDKCFEAAHNVGLDKNLSFNLLFGDPAETFETAVDNLKFYFKKRNTYKISCAMIILFPGSSLYQKYIYDKGVDSVDYINRDLPLMNITSMSDEMFAALKLIVSVSGSLADESSADDITDFSLYRSNDEYQEITVSYRCACREDNELLVTYLSDSLGLKQFARCPHCNKNMELPVIINSSESIGNKISEYCIEHKVAIWGIGRHFQRVARYLADAPFVMIDKAFDRNVTSAGLLQFENAIGIERVWSKLLSFDSRPRQIFNSYPENEHIDTVIVFSQYYDEISKEIRISNPNVKILYAKDFI